MEENWGVTGRYFTEILCLRAIRNFGYFSNVIRKSSLIYLLLVMKIVLFPYKFKLIYRIRLHLSQFKLSIIIFQVFFSF